MCFLICPKPCEIWGGGSIFFSLEDRRKSKFKEMKPCVESYKIPVEPELRALGPHVCLSSPSLCHATWSCWDLAAFTVGRTEAQTMKCLLQVMQLIHIGSGTGARDLVRSVFFSSAVRSEASWVPRPVLVVGLLCWPLQELIRCIFH